MALYEYTIIDTTNTIHRGVVRALSKSSAVSKLARPDVTPVTVIRVKSRGTFLNTIFGHFSRMDRITFTRNLMTMMRAGMSVADSLQSVREQTANPTIRKMATEAHRMVSEGKPLSLALKKYPRIFNPSYVAMIRIGERSGTLIQVLTYLTDQQEHDYRLLRKIRNALVYPTVILFTMLIIVVLLMIFVIPRISQIYADAHVALPVYTRALIGLSNFFQAQWYIIIATIVGIMLLFSFLMQQSQQFRYFIHRVIVTLPFISPIVKKINLALASRSLHMLTRAGISIDECLSLSADTTRNAVYRKAIHSTVPFVRRGVKLSDILKGNDRLFLPLFTKMIKTGEETGNLEEMFLHTAHYYDDDIQHWSANISTLIEPALLVCTGFVVGGIAFAVMFPLWNLANVI